MKIQHRIKIFAVPFIVIGLLLNSVAVIAQDPIPFNAMMQSAGAPAAVPPKPDSDAAANQKSNAGKITSGGKAEIVGGVVLFATGVLTVTATALLAGAKANVGSKGMALYVGGSGVAVVGVTLIALGSNRRHKK